MSQHDFNIDNQSAPAFRGDLNNALEALATLSSGGTAPSTTYANMLWYDSANNILKMRSEADDAWISIGTLNQSTNVFEVANVNELSQAQAEDDTSTVFGQVSGQRLAQATTSTLNASGSAPVYACRAWVNFNGTGTVAIRASGNVSSITDNGTGDYTVNFTTAMEDTSFCGIGSCGDTSTVNPRFVTVKGRTTSTLSITTDDSAGTKRDVDQVNVAIFR